MGVVCLTIIRLVRRPRRGLQKKKKNHRQAPAICWQRKLITGASVTVSVPLSTWAHVIATVGLIIRVGQEGHLCQSTASVIVHLPM